MHSIEVESRPDVHKEMPDRVCTWNPSITFEEYDAKHVDKATSAQFPQTGCFALQQKNIIKYT